MARFRCTGAVVMGAVKYPAGTIFVDARGEAQPGDVWWEGLDASKLSPNLVPLDALAVQMMGMSRFAGEPPWPASGAGSIG
jgi:hypothetical protein